MRPSGGRKNARDSSSDRSDGDTSPEGGSTPLHVAIIMDGNGRWAQNRGKRRLAGHRAGAAAVRTIVTAAAERGVQVLSLYAFSAENWSRPKTEVAGLFRLLKQFLKQETKLMIEQGIRLRALGRTAEFPADVRAAISTAEDRTSAGAHMTLCLALSYGGQDELVDAARVLAFEARRGMIEPEAIERHDVERCLYTSGLPPVDLLIRTGGDMRVSNFLLWQASYAELYFTDVCWPDFGREAFDAALADFARRERRFGGL